MPPASLVSLVRQRYLESVTSVQPASGWKLLILDEETQSRIQTLLKMYDILEQGVQQVELIGNQRNAFPRLEAVYILEPTHENIQRIIRDFQPAAPAQPATRKSPAVPASSGPKYAAAHLFFIDSLDDRLLEKLGNSPANQYLGTLKEIYVNFLPLEAQVFSIDNPTSFWTLYSPSAHMYREAMQEWKASLNDMANTILNMCLTLNEMPEIRYFAPEALNRPTLGPVEHQHVCYHLAKMVEAKLKAHAAENEDFQAQTESRPKGTLLITDRSMDLFAPFLHEFTYQAMCNDLLSVENGTHYHHSFRNEQGQIEEIDAVLSDDDKVWCEIKHMHMKDALDNLVDSFKQFNAEHGGPSGSSINDLKDMLASLPGMKESKEKLSLHLSMAEQCMAIFEERKLPITASVEQSCATGMSAEGKAPKTLVEEMVPLLDDRSVSREDKVRIIALYVLFRDGVPEEDRKRLYQHARLGMTEIDAVNHLVHLGQEVSKEARSKRKSPFKQVLREDAYDVSRYQPAVKLMLEEHISGKLDRGAFPYISAPADGSGGGSSLRGGGGNAYSSAPTAAPTSLRSARPRWTAGTKSKASNEPRQRLLVFVAGGVTYSEIRSAYQVSEANQKDVYIGSTSVLTPEGFIKDLATLERATADPSGSKSGTTRSAPEAVERPSKTSGRTAAMQQGLPTPSAREAAARTSQTSRYDSSESSGNRYAQWQDQREGSGRPSAPPPSQGSYRGASPAPTHTYNSSFSSGGGDGNRSSLRPPQGSQGGSHRMGPPLSNASSVSSLNSTPDKPKKKGLFGRLK